MAGVVPDLRLGPKIGNGHFGEVFLGDDGVHGRVAVKVLGRKAVQTDAEWLAEKSEFLTEAQNLSKARHQNVVQVHHIQELPDGNSIRYCMAFCPGGSLQSAFEGGPMQLLDLRTVATQVSMGLDALHTRGMLHRDIKPGNILRDGKGMAQLGDFGLVTDKLILGYASQAGYSDHVAPEVWRGNGTSTRTDIWALGMTLYRLLHGKTWYEEAPAPRLLVQNGGFADTLQWLPHIPKPWRRAIRKMLADDPARRYQSASQVLNALSPLPTQSWSASITPNLVRWTQPTGERRKIVEWTRHSARKHEWKAWSERAGDAGRKMTLGSSSEPIGKNQATSELESFFKI